MTGASRHDVPGATVVQVLRGLEDAHPAVAGWILDEQGRIRVHINVYVNRQPAQEDDPVGDGDQVHVLPSITGGHA
jgi:molybdopterin converting factor small subunit